MAYKLMTYKQKILYLQHILISNRCEGLIIPVF